MEKSVENGITTKWANQNYDGVWSLALALNHSIPKLNAIDLTTPMDTKIVKLPDLASRPDLADSKVDHNEMHQIRQTVESGSSYNVHVGGE